MKTTNLFFVLGLPGAGKTAFSQSWIKYQISKSKSWCLLDKDTVGDRYSNALMIEMGVDPMDRDSDLFKSKVRDLDYSSTIDIARENLELGISVICPAPWTKELNSGLIFSHEKLRIDKEVNLMHIYIDSEPKKIKENIIKRGHPKDKWKLNNWDKFEKTLVCPENVENNRILKINADEVVDFIEIERKLNAN